MSRKAILIEASQTKHGDLPGARADLKNMKAYLTSNVGGAWNEDEITEFHTPLQNDVNAAIQGAHFYSYTFVAFFGHGEHLVRKELFDTSVILNDYESMLVKELDPNNSRRSLLIDACRNVRIIKERYDFGEFVKASTMVAGNRMQYREKFDTAINAAEPGPIRMYSCDINESADESNSGGLFTKSMLNCATSWAEHGIQGTYTTRDGFYCAYGATNVAQNSQHPQYEAGRRITHFPFAIQI